jgi:hypothetical protein
MSDWAISAFSHDAYQCRAWLFPHVHRLVVISAPADIGRVLRDYEGAFSR